MNGEKIGNEHGPVVVSSKLGWLVSGPLSIYTELSILCNAIAASSSELPGPRVDNIQFHQQHLRWACHGRRVTALFLITSPFV